ncbi:uncharacterized protein VNE69_06095 [Vairimorpha necatrix]|uniref:Uncharacterized protein n=1 Tax=Vairimorpha necatrix TaxID=6039 RepID=A0AAX4JCU6_9MICR
MNHFIKKEGHLKDGEVYDNKVKDNRKNSSGYKKNSTKKSDDTNTIFNFDDEFGTRFNFSFSNNIERNEAIIDPRDIFTENNNSKDTNLNLNIFNEKNPMFDQKNISQPDSDYKNPNQSSALGFQYNTDYYIFQDNNINRGTVSNNRSTLKSENINKKPSEFNSNSYINNNLNGSTVNKKESRSADFNSRKINEVAAKRPQHPNPQMNQRHQNYYNGNPQMMNYPPQYRSHMPNSFGYSRNQPNFSKSNPNMPPAPYNHPMFYNPAQMKQYPQNTIGVRFTSHRINPTNNSVLNLNRIFVPPVNKTKPLKKIIKKVIRLMVDGKSLHDFRTINISSNYKNPNMGHNEMSFLGNVNAFNEKHGIMKIPYKYGTVLNFVFTELKKFNGYYKTSLVTWNQLSQVIKHFSWINQIYLFLVYPFEQYVFGIKQVRVYEDKKIQKKFEEDFSRFTTTDIDICLSKGKISDILFLMESIDPHKIKIEGISILLNFFVDIIHVKYSQLFKDNPFFLREKEVPYNKLDFEGGSLFDKIRKIFFIKLEEINEEKSLILLKKCISISVAHGEMCKMKYLGFNIDQNFLNKIFNIMVILKNNNIIETNLILDFIRVCSKTYFYENHFINKLCYKLCKTDPIATLEILTTVKFSKRHNKKFLKELRKFIIPKIEYFSKALFNHDMLDDNKLLENIIISFACIKSMKNIFKEIFKGILLHYEFVYTNRLYYKKKSSSDLFKIILVMVSYDDVKSFLYSDSELMRKLKNIPGIRDLI